MKILCLLLSILVSSVVADDLYSVSLEIEDITCLRSQRSVNDVSIVATTICANAGGTMVKHKKMPLRRTQKISQTLLATKTAKTNNTLSIAFAVVHNLNRSSLLSEKYFQQQKMRQKMFSARFEKFGKNSHHQAIGHLMVPVLRQEIRGKTSNPVGFYAKGHKINGDAQSRSVAIVKVGKDTYKITYLLNFARLQQRQHLKVVLKNVKCFETEDITGKDDFYVAGGRVLSSSTKGKDSYSFCTSPRRINNGQTVTLNHVIFDGEVAKSDEIMFAVVAFDEDAAKDANKIRRITNAIQKVLEKLPTEELLSIDINPFVKGLSDAIVAISKLDKDDNLGKIVFRKKVDDITFPHKTFGKIKTGKKIIVYNLRSKKTFNSFSYRLRFEIQKHSLGVSD